MKVSVKTYMRGELILWLRCWPFSCGFSEIFDEQICFGFEMRNPDGRCEQFQKDAESLSTWIKNVQT